MTMNVRSVFLTLLAALTLLAGCSSTTPSPTTGEDKLRVSGSFYVLEDFIQGVGDENITYVSVVPDGVIGHNYEPTAQDIARLHGLDLFVFQGGGFDPWAEKLRPDLEADGVKVVEMSDSFDLRPAPLAEEDAEETADDEADEDKGGLDPHIWLDPLLAAQEVEIIGDMLAELDPAHAQDYQTNADAYIAVLQQLDKKFSQGLSHCQQNAIIAAHDAYNYLGARYEFEIVAIAGISPDAEPSAGRMAELAELARSRNIRYIFFEGLVSPQLSETLARELGAATLVLNPIEGRSAEQSQQMLDYAAIMQQNLDNLRLARKCD